MIMECMAILILLGIMAGYFYLGRKPAHAVLTLSLMIVPFFHLFSGRISRMIVRLDAVSNEMFVQICVHVAALMISCILVGGFARNIRSRKVRWTWTSTSFIFIFCITAVLLHAVI